MAELQKQQPSSKEAHNTKALVGALNILSRNLPLPPDLFNTVSSISLNSSTEDGLLADLDDALSKQRSNCASGFKLCRARESRYQSFSQHRLTQLEGLPSSRGGDDLQTRSLLEYYGLKLAELQRMVRSDVSSEYWLNIMCAYPERQLFDWGVMRLHRPMYGVGDPFAMDADDKLRKKRDAERISRLEEQAKNHIETRKRRFFTEIVNTVREFQLQIQASLKRRKQRNDGVQAWHGRQRQRATRAEKLRFQALKADDQEAYMRMVKESKNERLTLLLEETNKLLVNLGAAVQRQRDSKQSDGIEPLEDSEADLPESDTSKSGISKESPLEEDADLIDSDQNGESSDLLEGQRQYNSAIHSIQEKVTEQPSILQGGELRPYQLEGLQWMLSLFNNNLNGILADEMGLGKTIQTISLIAYLMEHKGVTGPHLIVAPKAVLPNWMNEFSTWAPRYVQWHRLKNHECALARTLDSSYHIQRRLLLTGTPIQNSLQELWSLLNFLLPSIFNSVQNFEDWFNAPFADRVDVSLTDEEQLLVIRRLHQVIRPFILRRKKDEVEKYLPGKSQVILKCDMSAWQKVYYQQVTDVGRVGLDNGSGKSRSLQNLTMQLRKCCNHPYLFVGDYHMYNRKEEVVRASGKFELLDRLLPKLRRAGHRVLLFSQMTRLMDILEIYLRLHDFKFLRLDGSTKTEERGSLLRKFNAPDSPYFMFLLSTRAGGLGLNLQSADTVIIFDSDWNPQMDQQAEDRAHRIGQKKEVRVFVLVSVGSIEEVILERAKQKMGIDAKVIQAGLFNTTSTAQDRREMLQEIMRRGTSSLGTDVPSEREINRLAARSDEEFWLFEKMDEERRQREDYRSRLMEEHEVPDWVYSALNKDDQVKAFDALSVTGKRKRKEVVYADTLSDLQWMRAMENGQDVSKLSAKGKRRGLLPSDKHAQTSNKTVAGERLLEQRSRSVPEMKIESSSADDFILSPSSKRLKTEEPSSQKHGSESGFDEHTFSWNIQRKKRTSYPGQGSSSDTRDQNANDSK
ncbi:putative ATP-dependent DNA helicase chr12 [Stylosanthes scabra]|uniref:ATP-dependent DNA helicase chr12 n=1 Tax=Stylosanthes scabra TaxID=79078 RepID=A0ABU6WF32_9FABA|nr:putative ATP-dependent DNA helicase chr12 [Stylosanthes scabra]